MRKIALVFLFSASSLIRAASWTATTPMRIEGAVAASSMIAATSDGVLEIDESGRIIRTTDVALGMARIARAGSNFVLAGSPQNQSGVIHVARMNQGQVDWGLRIAASQDLNPVAVAGSDDGSIVVAAHQTSTFSLLTSHF